MIENSKSSVIGHDASYGTITVGGKSAALCKGDGKAAVLERQSLLYAATIVVTEVSADDLDESQESPNRYQSPVAARPADDNGLSTTFMTMYLRLFLPFFLYCLAVGAVAAPKITIVLALLCRKTLPDPPGGSIQNDDICATPSVHVEMSRFMVYANVISGVLCALSGPQLCRWSDRYGRKPLIAVSVAGMLLGDVVSMLAASFPQRIPVYWILIEFVFGGLTGAFFTTMALMQSYLSDITRQDQRTAAFGVLHACMFLGLGLGPGAGAFYMKLIGGGDMLSVFYVAGACHLVFVLYILFLLPESLPEAVQKTKDLEAREEGPDPAKGRVYCILDILHPLQLFRQQSAEMRRSRQIKVLRALAGIDFLAFGVQIGLPPLLVVYSQFRFDWKTVEASLFLSVTNMTRGLVLAIILPFSMWLMRSKPVPQTSRVSIITNNTSTSDCRIYVNVVQVSIGLEVLGQIGFAMSKSPVSFVSFGVVTAAGAPVSPVVQSLMTFYVDPSRWGELFGAVTLMHSVARACVPAFMMMVYGLTVRDASSAIYWVLSVFFGGAFLASIWINHLQRACQAKPGYAGA